MAPSPTHAHSDGHTPSALMQPSQDEIQREVENLRDIRRRSTAQGGLVIDPDLPATTAQGAAAAAAYWSPTATDDSSSGDSHSNDGTDESASTASDDPFHLFWVPARMHPEIDPAQFRAFLKEHARAPADGGAPLGRTNSMSSLASTSSGASGLGRKKSMLSRQYQPSEHEQPEDERVVPLRRNRTSYYQASGPQLTIRDLEKLDELAEEASNSSDPSKLRSVLRRSLSMNVAPSVIDKMDNMPDMSEDADAPIIVPPPGLILRRAQRTKIRKPGQTGEGSHRFNATRRGPGARLSSGQVSEPRSSSDLSASDHGEQETPPRKRVLSTESLPDRIHDEPPRLVRPESYSTEAFILDAYARDDTSDEDVSASLELTLAEHPPPRRSLSPPPPPPVQEPEPPLPISPIPLRHPQPQPFQVVPPAPAETPSRTPSPESRASMSYNEPSSQPVRPVLPERTNSQITVAPSDQQRKDKDKKGLFGKWGGEKKSKKEERLEREREKEKEKEKEKQSSFSFGALFGGSKKKHEESSGHGMGHHGHNAGREAAVALLGASKSKSGTPSPSPQPPGVNNYSRYPIHVERAIYRLSHIKLANPRRALYEQVLISNLMFWYLGVINKAQQQPGAAAGAAGAGAVGAGGAAQNAQNVSPEEKERQEAERKEKEERERAEKEQAEKERERERAEQKAQSRRGSLTKTPAAGTGAGNRRAEMPVRGPQYDMQHRAMEQEYGYGGGPPPPGRSGSAPPQSGYQGSSQPSPVAQPQPHRAPIHYFGTAVPNTPMQNPVPHRTGSPQLPPGAMPPIDPELPQYPSPSSPTPVTRVSSNPPSQRTKSPPGAHASPRHSRSPPPQNRYAPSAERVPQPGVGAGGGKAPGRSRSATATPQPPPVSLNGKTRKTTSAHATVAAGTARRPRTSEGPEGGGEEEDVPLAVWQQQQQSSRRR
ncbi:hypothetical protein DENSPDRAFT_878673 [Dentipellis sp. KUC8613]|nr:hypothetical protein DENSPDRAFT_878673 [Dentipellis sp. KUC8613]